MKLFKKLFIALLVLAILAPTSWAAEGDSNFTNLVASGTGTFGSDLTFRGSLLANGRAGGASSMSSSSTFIGSGGLAYSIIFKRVGGGGGLDSLGIGSTLPNGVKGQVLSIYITALQSGGSWVVTPTKSTNFNKIVFDTVGDNAQLTYLDDTFGWVVNQNNGAVLTMNQIP